MKIVDLLLLCDVEVHFQALLKEILEVFKFVRFPIECGHRGGHGFE